MKTILTINQLKRLIRESEVSEFKKTPFAKKIRSKKRRHITEPAAQIAVDALVEAGFDDVIYIDDNTVSMYFDDENDYYKRLDYIYSALKSSGLDYEVDLPEDDDWSDVHIHLSLD